MFGDWRLRVPDWNNATRFLMSRIGSYEQFDRAGVEFSGSMPAENAHEHSFSLKHTELILWGTKKGNGEVTREAATLYQENLRRKLQRSLSRGESRLSLSSIARRHQIARDAKILVPSLRKAGDDLLDRLARYFHAGMHNVPPGVNTRPASYGFFERDPLRQDDSERVVNPADFSRGLAISDHMAHHGIHRLYDFDLQPAARFPGTPFAPVQLAVNVRKLIPTTAIGEYLPDALPAGLGGDTILKSKHSFSSLLFARSRFFDLCWIAQRMDDLGSIIYTLLV